MIKHPGCGYPKYFQSRPLSASAIKSYLSSPEEFAYNRFDEDFERTESASARAGTDFHMAVLEPDEYAKKYRTITLDRRTKAGKEAYAEMVEGGYEIRSQAETEATMKLRERFLANPKARALVDRCEFREKEIIFDHEEFPDLKMVSRIDAFTIQSTPMVEPYGVDIKTVKSADESEIARSAAFGRWDVQEAVYRAAVLAGYGVTLSKFYFIVVERDPPYRIRVRVLGRDERISGVMDFNQSVSNILGRYQAWDWEPLDQGLEIEYPGWYKQRYM